MEKQIATFKDYAIFMADKTSLLEIALFVVRENYSHHLSSFTEILATKLLQKSEMRKDIVIELSYKGFSCASDYS